jgi:hypothetical protein
MATVYYIELQLQSKTSIPHLPPGSHPMFVAGFIAVKNIYIHSQG